jgi:uncharacterized protein
MLKPDLPMPRLLIVGASARAAAASARRAGFDPWCADLFGDADLRRLAPDSVRCPADEYPAGLVDILRDAPAGPLIFTGGLENHANLVRALGELRPLWGNGPDALARSRSPFTIERLLREGGLPVPEVRADRPGDGRWLRKPYAGAAGQGIAFAEPDRPQSRRHSRSHYYQQFVSGPSMSAVFVRVRGEVRLLGTTEQLIGVPWLNAGPFRYAGNIGPIEVPTALRDDLLRVGQVIGNGCDLLGLFGVDFIWHNDRPWVVEVNPRYPASIEVLERATTLVTLSHHRAAFDPGGQSLTGPILGGPVAGKAILYAHRRLIMPDYTVGPLADVFGPDVEDPARQGARYADIPRPGEVIEAGWPILTLLGHGNDRSPCEMVLQERARHFARLLFLH